ncbi:histone-fold-containing protein [Chlamydoabsidia padenii]|nr:histone-fold-containing protein [Chlamydoabsidia padenii]
MKQEDFYNRSNTAPPTSPDATARKRMDKRRGQRSYGSFTSQIKKIHKQIFPEGRISSKNDKHLHGYIRASFKIIASEAHELAKKEHDGVTNERDIEYACRLLLPKDLAEHANNAGAAAVKRYKAYQKD